MSLTRLRLTDCHKLEHLPAKLPELKEFIVERCPSLKVSPSELSQRKEILRLQTALEIFLTERREQKTGFEGVALIIGSAEGKQVQNDPAFLKGKLEGKIKKIYIDPEFIDDPKHHQWDKDRTNSYSAKIYPEDNEVTHLLGKVLQEEGKVFIYDNSYPYKIGERDNFSYHCARNILENAKNDVKFERIFKNLYLVIGYIDNFPRLLVKNEFIAKYPPKNARNIFEAIAYTQRIEKETYYEAFNRTLTQTLNNKFNDIKLFRDDKFDVDTGEILK